TSTADDLGEDAAQTYGVLTDAHDQSIQHAMVTFETLMMEFESWQGIEHSDELVALGELILIMAFTEEDYQVIWKALRKYGIYLERLKVTIGLDESVPQEPAGLEGIFAETEDRFESLAEVWLPLDGFTDFEVIAVNLAQQAPSLKAIDFVYTQEVHQYDRLWNVVGT
ncbi:hypothetical protein HGRIS_011891, partial [Hohenbuehelia grisea]